MFLIKIQSTFRPTAAPSICMKKVRTDRIQNIPGEFFSPKIISQVCWGLEDMCPKRTLGRVYFKLNFALDRPRLSSWMFPWICLLLCQMYEPWPCSANATTSPSLVCNHTDRILVLSEVLGLWISWDRQHCFVFRSRLFWLLEPKNHV